MNVLITLRHVEISKIKVGKHTWCELNLSNFTLKNLINALYMLNALRLTCFDVLGND